MSKQKFCVSSLKPFGVDVAGLDPKAIVERKYFTPEVKLMESEEKTIIAKISCHDIDADGDLVYASGCDMSRYQKNPVVMFAHDYTQAPIAKATELRITEDGVEAKIKFADTDRANEMWSLVKGGFLRAHSVGFITRRELIAGTKEFKDFCTMKSLNVGKNCKRIVSDWLLLEDSVVPIPSNPEALTQAVSMKDIIGSDPIGASSTDPTPTVISAPADEPVTVNLAINDAINLLALNQPIQISSGVHSLSFNSSKELLEIMEQIIEANKSEQTIQVGAPIPVEREVSDAPEVPVSNPEPITQTAIPTVTTDEGTQGDDGAAPKMFKSECLMCGKEFESERESHKFCSKDCFHKYLRERVKRVAGKTLTPEQIETFEQTDLEGKDVQAYYVIRETPYELDESTKAKIREEVEQEIKMVKAGKVV